MDPISWTAFGLINGLLLFVFQGKQQKRSLLPSVLMGVCGALSGGFTAYALFASASIRLSGTLLFVLAIETAIFLFLYFSRSLKTSQ